jgi:hypothetical protein
MKLWEEPESTSARNSCLLRVLHRSDRPLAPVRPVKPWQLGMSTQPQVNSPKSKYRSPDPLHRFKQDFGDSSITSWAFHSHDLVHQNLLNKEESKTSHHKRL